MKYNHKGNTFDLIESFEIVENDKKEPPFMWVDKTFNTFITDEFKRNYPEKYFSTICTEKMYT